MDRILTDQITKSKPIVHLLHLHLFKFVLRALQSETYVFLLPLRI